jgi:hypothetical protein
VAVREFSGLVTNPRAKNWSILFPRQLIQFGKCGSHRLGNRFGDWEVGAVLDRLFEFGRKLMKVRSSQIHLKVVPREG